MPQYEQPNPMPSWAEGDGALVSQPTPSQIASGYTQSERPTAQSINWLFRQLSRAYRFVSQGVNAVLIGSQQEFDFRLLGGGSWSWSASTNTLAWSEAFTVSMPGLADSVNTCAAGSVTLTAGQIAYVSINTPFATTGTLTSGSKTVTDLDFESGIVVGASVTGTGIQSGTTVASISQSDSSITLSVAPTASGSKVRLIFATSGALAVSAADVATFAPANNTAVIARCIAGPQNHVIVGLNSGQFRLLDNEAKRLLGQGYVTTARLTAGAALAARQPIYISPGGEGRLAGTAYPLDVSAAGTSIRATFAGFCISQVAQGAQFEAVMSGRLNGFNALTPGTTYYGNPNTPTSLGALMPSVAGQYVVPLGTAVSSDTLLVAGPPPAPVRAVGATIPFAGPVSAPGFISVTGFKAPMNLGAIAIDNAQANSSYSLGFVIPRSTTPNTTNYDSAFEPVGAAGSILRVMTRSVTGSNGNLFIYRATATDTIGVLIAQVGVSGSRLYTSTTLTKGIQSFGADDYLYATFSPSTAGNLQIRVSLLLEYSA